MAAHNDLGKWGEDIAAEYLHERGYRILARDWKSGHRDIDIVATDGECLVFVEVKARRNRNFGSPVEAVNYTKLRNLRQAINHFVCSRQIDMPFRLDIISVVGGEGQPAEIEHIKDCSLPMR